MEQQFFQNMALKTASYLSFFSISLATYRPPCCSLKGLQSNSKKPENANLQTPFRELYVFFQNSFQPRRFEAWLRFLQKAKIPKHRKTYVKPMSTRPEPHFRLFPKTA